MPFVHLVVRQDEDDGLVGRREGRRDQLVLINVVLLTTKSSEVVEFELVGEDWFLECWQVFISVVRQLDDFVPRRTSHPARDYIHFII